MVFNNSLFRITLSVSLLGHAVLFLPSVNFKTGVKTGPVPFVMTCYKMVFPAQTQDAPQSPPVTEKSLKGQNPVRPGEEPSPLAKDPAAGETPAPAPPPRAKIQPVGENRNEAVPAVTARRETGEFELSAHKSYLHYYDLVNEKLRNSLVRPAQFFEGEVTLSFIVLSDGNLQSVEVVGKNSSANEILRAAAMQIVKNASPFPPFPEDLRRLQLTFNVVIYFCEKT